MFKDLDIGTIFQISRRNKRRLIKINNYESLGMANCKDLETNRLCTYDRFFEVIVVGKLK